MKSITDREADEWIARMKPEQVRSIVQEWHALKQGLCSQTLAVPTGVSDWVDRAIAAAFRLRQCEIELRKLLSVIDVACVDAKMQIRHTVCTSCRGGGQVNDKSCATCRGTGLREFI